MPDATTEMGAATDGALLVAYVLLAAGLLGLTALVMVFSASTWWSRKQVLVGARERPIRRRLPPISHQSFPLRIEARGRASRVERALLRSRLAEWARVRGFDANLGDETRMRFTRGSTLLTSVAFGVRYIPTTVCVDVERDTLRWSFLTASALQYLAQDDREEGAFEIGLFLESLEGACLTEPASEEGSPRTDR